MSNSNKVTSHTILYVYVLATTKTRHWKSIKKHKKIKNIKTRFLNFYKKILKTFFTSMTRTLSNSKLISTRITSGSSPGRCRTWKAWSPQHCVLPTPSNCLPPTPLLSTFRKPAWLAPICNRDKRKLTTVVRLTNDGLDRILSDLVYR